MIPCLNTVTVGGGLSLEEAVALAGRHGYGGLDFDTGSVLELASKTSMEAVKELFERNKVALGSTWLALDWRGEEDAYQSSLEQLPEHAAAAQALGCTRCCTFLPPTVDVPVEEFRTMAVRRFKTAAKILADYGIAFGLEWVGPKTSRTKGKPFIYTMDGALELEEEIDEPNLGLLVDSFHWYTGHHTREDLARLPVEKIVHVHVNDAPDRPVDEQIDSQRLLPGEGVIDLIGMLTILKEKGYAGYLAIETFSQELPKLGPDIAAAKAKAALDSVLARVR